MIREKIKESQAKRANRMEIDGAGDYLAVLLATGFGAGLIPLAPGTWGSLVGLLAAYGLIDLFKDKPILLQNVLIVAGLLTAIAGIWAGSRAERIFNRKDPGQIVIDEVCGQIITFAFIAPYISGLGQDWRWWTLAGFALFRVGDILKPYPINHLQDLRGGFGVMMDDIMAGIYAAAALSLLLYFFG